MNPYQPGQTFAADVAYAINHSLDLPRLRSVVGEHVAAAVRDERIAQAEHILLGGSGGRLFAVISVANSGGSSRARETVLLAKDLGATTLGITGSLTGALARQADRVVHCAV